MYIHTHTHTHTHVYRHMYSIATVRFGSVRFLFSVRMNDFPVNLTVKLMRTVPVVRTCTYIF